MDPTSVSPQELAFYAEVTKTLLEYGPMGALALGGGGFLWAWWKSAQKHLCEAIPQIIAIADRISKEGLIVKVQLIEQEDTEEVPRGR